MSISEENTGKDVSYSREHCDFPKQLSVDEDRAQSDSPNEILIDGKTYESSNSDFLRHFLKSSGPPQVIALCLLIALALGSTVGVVPAVVEDRYARLNHGYNGEASCLDIPKIYRPEECLFGNEDAQNAAALSGFIHSTLTFATSSLIGSISDERGRVGEETVFISIISFHSFKHTKR